MTLPRPQFALLAPAIVLTLCAARPAQAQDTLPPGILVGDAISADITETGVNYIAEQFLGLIPPDLTIGSIPPQQIFEIPWVCTEEFWIDNLIVHTQINSVTVDGQEDALVLNVDLDLWLNDPSDTATVYLDGCIDYVCNLHTTPANVVMSLPVTLAIAQDENGDDFVDITFGDLSHNIQSALAGAIYLTGCAVGDIDAWLNDNLGFSTFDLIVGQFVGEIESQVADALVDLEESGEDALKALWLEDTTDILDTELTYEIHPSEVDHNEHGLRLILAGRTLTDPHPCVAEWAGDGSPLTDGPLPPMTPSIPSNNAIYHLGALLADDFANQALWNLWNGGVMCFVVRDGDVDGFAIDTTLFGLIGGQDAPDLFAQFFPFGPAPMVIRTLPETPPLVTFDGPNDINVAVENLHVQFVPMILDRYSNLVQVAIDVDAGVDISVADDGALAIDIFLDTDNLNPRVTYNELDPDSNAVVEQNFGTLVNAVINLVGAGLLEGMKIAMPTFGGGDDDDSASGDDDDSAAGDDDDSAAPLGLGLVQLDVEPVGMSSALLDFMGAYATLGQTTGGESSGGCDSCGDSGGCGDCGGEGGCGDCGDITGCNIEEELQGSGCSGETSDQPSDLGCQGCRLGHGVHRVSKNHWRLVLDAEGLRSHPEPTRKHRHKGIHPAAMLWLVAPAILMRRRRRSSER